MKVRRLGISQKQIGTMFGTFSHTINNGAASFPDLLRDIAKLQDASVEGLDAAVKGMMRTGAVSVEGRWTEIARAVDVLDEANSLARPFRLRMSVGIPAPNKTDIDIVLEIDGRSIFYECKTTANALFGGPDQQSALVEKLRKQLTKDPDAELRFLFADTGTTDAQSVFARGFLETGYGKVPPSLLKKLFKHDATGKLILTSPEGSEIASVLDDLFEFRVL